MSSIYKELMWYCHRGMDVYVKVINVDDGK